MGLLDELSPIFDIEGVALLQGLGNSLQVREELLRDDEPDFEGVIWQILRESAEHDRQKLHPMKLSLDQLIAYLQLFLVGPPVVKGHQLFLAILARQVYSILAVDGYVGLQILNDGGGLSEELRDSVALGYSEHERMVYESKVVHALRLARNQAFRDELFQISGQTFREVGNSQFYLCL